MKVSIRLVFIILFSVHLLACFEQPSSVPSMEKLESGLDINCLAKPESIAWAELLVKNCNRFSDYGLFETIDPRVNPRTPGNEYFISTELFTDYAKKFRFVFIPYPAKIKYKELSAFGFPVGTVLVKTFVLPLVSNGDGVDIVETRLLIRRESGWVGLPYIWNEEKTEAYLSLTGASIEKTMIVNGVGITFDYQVPNVSDCRTCHIVRRGGVNKTAPIGLKMRHLNRNINFLGRDVNQLLLWEELGFLEGLPDNLDSMLSVPLWADEKRTLQDRAKGYLDINCSHCHTPGGSGSESGMFLEYWRLPEYFDHGVCKRPGGFNGGALGLVYDLTPGNSDESLIPYRMSLLASEGDEKGQMPPLSRHINHTEGVQLIRDWIDSMEARPCR